MKHLNVKKTFFNILKMFLLILCFSLIQQVKAQQNVQLFGNNSFENGTLPWLLIGNVAKFNLQPANTGSWYIAHTLPDGSSGNNLSGNLVQTVQIPANTNNLKISWFQRITTAETGNIGYDYMRLKILINNVWQEVYTQSNLDASANYVYKEVNLNTNLSSITSVGFFFTTDNTLPTTFRLDDVNAIASIPQICNTILSPTTTNNVPSAGGNFQFNITLPNSCPWTSLFMDPFITPTGITSGNGSSILSFLVAPNPSTNTRWGAVNINGINHDVNQLGLVPTCLYSLAANNIIVGSSAGNANLSIQTSSNCNWAANTTASWIHINNPISGLGNGTISFFYDANISASNRIATINVAALVYTITQNGIAPCSYNLPSNNITVNSASGNSNFSILTTSGCNWNATTSSSWLHLLNQTSGSGNGTISFSYDANLSTNIRNSPIQVGGQTYSVSQNGANNCTYSLSSYSENIIASGGSKTITVNSGNCNYQAVPSSSNINITSGQNGSSGGIVSYTVLPNTSTNPLSENININGQIHNIYQAGLSVFPVVKVLSPNGGESLAAGATYEIKTSATGNVNGYEIYYTTNGNNWIYIIGVSSSSNNYNFNWSVPNTYSTNCKIRVKAIYSNGSLIDESDNNFTISQGVAFSLNSNLSHLGWPFPNSKYEISQRDGWNGGQEGGVSGGCGHGCGGHKGGDFFADDWNKDPQPSDCNKQFLSPIGGKIIFVYKDCSNLNSCNPGQSNCSSSPGGYGNQVLVQSSIDNNFIFRVTHLNAVSVILGQTVDKGTKLGEIGSTGASISSHAHCVLYKNVFNIYNGNIKAIDRLKQGSTLGFTGPASQFAANFLFDAVAGDFGRSNNLSQNDSLNSIQISPNPTFDGNFTINFNADENQKAIIYIYNNMGHQISFQEKNIQAGYNGFNITNSGLVSGIYMLTIRLRNRLLTTRFIVN